MDQEEVILGALTSVVTTKESMSDSQTHKEAVGGEGKGEGDGNRQN